jgi:hypothetical protein
MNLGQKIDKLFNLREEKLKQNEIVKTIQRQFDDLQDDIILNLQGEDIKKATGEKASASVSMGFYPTVNDLEIFATWCVKNKKYEMMQRRLSSAAVKEMYDETNKLPPGTEAYTKAKLNLRRI